MTEIFYTYSSKFRLFSEALKLVINIKFECKSIFRRPINQTRDNSAITWSYDESSSHDYSGDRSWVKWRNIRRMWVKLIRPSQAEPGSTRVP